MKLKTVSLLRHIINVNISIILILMAIGGIIGIYFSSSYIQLYYYYIPRYNSTYNMITGCLLNNTNCNKLSCYEPFYKNCISAGIFAVLMSIIPIIAITMLLIIVITNCGKYHQHALINKNKNDNDNETILNDLNCNINGDEFHTIDLNDNEYELHTINRPQINNDHPTVMLESSDTIKLSSSSGSSSGTSTTKANVSLEYNESQNDNTFISEIEKTGNMSYSG